MLVVAAEGCLEGFLVGCGFDVSYKSINTLDVFVSKCQH
jgi:hypothetical protein